MTSIVMSQETFNRLRELIYTRSGLEFPESKKYLLESRLRSRLAAVHCRTFEEYYHFLRFDPQREQEFTELFNCITTNETFFFRDMAQLDCFRHMILPQIIKEREKTKSLRIWSAGCSSGEEPYTLAMIIMEEFPALTGWDVRILGTDISEHMLQAAERGVYGPYAVRHIPPRYLRKYFTGSEGQYTIDPMLRRLVKFSVLNLFDSMRMRTIREIDIIFCRNVLIYFDQEARKRIVTDFYHALRDPGVFVIGFSESLNGINRLFRPMPWNKTIVYYKASAMPAPSMTVAGSSNHRIPQSVNGSAPAIQVTHQGSGQRSSLAPSGTESHPVSAGRMWKRKEGVP
ncbi:MAG: protein-glutamate O-methyltransferase CheR [Nitrospirae bacterium]|nr:MAG: protein-glutamate O-methyltransferase CheR [Nitrospirota bacterium]